MSAQDEVDPDTLEYLSEGMYLLNGQPFTGLGVQRYPDGGKWSEIPFVDGREHGVARSWHRNGQLEGETTYWCGQLRGPRREWFEDGSLHSEEMIEFGFLIRKEVYNQQQELIEQYERPESDPMYPKIIAWRREAGAGK